MFKWKNKKSKNTNSDINIELNDNDIYVEDEMKTFIPVSEKNNQPKVETIKQEEVLIKKTEPIIEEIKADFYPLGFNDLQRSSWMLVHNKKVIVSFAKMDKENRSKSLNFFAGILYALEGSKTKIGKGVYEFTVSK